MAMDAPAEKTFLNEGGVTVTNTRFIVPAQTFAMSGITSVKSFEERKSKTLPILLIVLGVLTLLGARDAGPLAVALAILAVGIGLLMRKPTFYVLLSVASGEAKALSSKDGAWISKVVAALNDSIVHRG